MEYKKYIEYVSVMAEAHQDNAKPNAKTKRTFPNGTSNPYFTHSLWCSMMIQLETTLPEKLREQGSLALLFHDVLEDTQSSLPTDLPKEVVEMVQAMTFETWDDEVRETLAHSAEIQLLKLYDKVATLVDGALNPKRYSEWIEFTEKLIDTTEQNYGQLNIVLLAKALVSKYKISIPFLEY